jgi:hypothetical protein
MVALWEVDVNENRQKKRTNNETGNRKTGSPELEKELNALISGNDGDQLKYLKERWRPQVVHAEDRVKWNRNKYFALRLPTVLGAVSLPPLASPTVEAPWARWAALVISLVVALCTAVEGLFRFGNRWRLYRRMLDELRREGWSYAYKIGDYEREETATFSTFVDRSEDILRRYGEEFITDVVVLGGPPQPTTSTQPATST